MNSLMLETVTPDMARRWLLSAEQVPVDMGKARTLCAAMRSPEWVPDTHKPRPVIIKGGKLVDGNHRCIAVILTAAPVVLWVKYV
jgi:hypothetical protein